MLLCFHPLQQRFRKEPGTGGPPQTGGGAGPQKGVAGPKGVTVMGEGQAKTQAKTRGEAFLFFTTVGIVMIMINHSFSNGH